MEFVCSWEHHSVWFLMQPSLVICLKAFSKCKVKLIYFEVMWLTAVSDQEALEWISGYDFWSLFVCIVISFWAESTPNVFRTRPAPAIPSSTHTSIPVPLAVTCPGCNTVVLRYGASDPQPFLPFPSIHTSLPIILYLAFTSRTFRCFLPKSNLLLMFSMVGILKETLCVYEHDCRLR